MSAARFPLRRAAGRVLESAKLAASAAAVQRAEQYRRQAETTPWGDRKLIALVNDEHCRRAAVQAAMPILGQLTGDEEMALVIAYGIADEVMVRVRTRGAA